MHNFGLSMHFLMWHTWGLKQLLLAFREGKVSAKDICLSKKNCSDIEHNCGWVGVKSTKLNLNLFDFLCINWIFHHYIILCLKHCRHTKRDSFNLFLCICICISHCISRCGRTNQQGLGESWLSNQWVRNRHISLLSPNIQTSCSERHPLV